MNSNKSRGYFAIITALIACPCHFPITLPLIIGLASGTAIGAFLQQNLLLVYVAAILYFLGGLWLGWPWLFLAKEGKRGQKTS